LKFHINHRFCCYIQISQRSSFWLST